MLAAMKTPTPKELGTLLEEAGIPASVIAGDIGRDKDYVRDFIVGRKKSLKAGDMEKIIERLRSSMPLTKINKILGKQTVNVEHSPWLRVEGIVEAGNFRDVSLVEDDPDSREILPVAADPRYPHARQYALEVSGDSMDQIVKDGAYVTCVSWADSGLALEPKMVLHVERHIGPLIETTLKRFEIRDGKRWLCPASSNPKHQPIEINGDDSSELVIKGMMIGRYEKFDYRT